MTSEPRPAPALSSGWRIALLRGGLAFAIMALLGQALAFGGVVANGGGLSTLDTFRLGVAYFALFHGVAIDLEVPSVSVGGGVGDSPPATLAVSYGMTVALLLATGLALVLLYRAGRAAADRAGGSLPVRALHGLKVAPGYAVLSLLLLLLAVFHVTLPSNPLVSGTLTIRPSPAAAFLLPLAIAAAAGLAGGVRSGREAATEPWGRRTLGVLAGGWRMFLAGLVLAFVGLLVQAAVQPGATSAYFRGVFDQGPGRGSVIVAHHVLLLPNQSMFVLVPAMGASDQASVLGSTTTLISYWDFPRSVSASPESILGTMAPVPRVEGGIAPPAYFLYLLVPLGAVLLGGGLAAGRGGAGSRGEAARLGAAAGVPFAILVAVASLASGFAVKASAGIGLALSLEGRVGPAVATGGLVALVWGVAGGAVGGFLRGRGLPASPPVPVPEEGAGRG